MTTINRLAGAAFGIHIADQIALVSVPLVAALTFNASAEVIGMLVACQTLAHLLGSIPFGMLVDRGQLRTLVLASALVSLIGFSGVSASVYLESLAGFGAAITLAGFGVVLFSLCALSIVPLAAGSGDLARANATIEVPRTIVSFLVPLAVGILITGLAVEWFFLAAMIGAASAFFIALRLPEFKKTTQAADSIFNRLRDGARFVVNNNYLRAISLCAVFWNLAFTALLVVMVPLLAGYYQLDPGTFGIALASFGLAAIAGTWTARQLGNQFPPNILLIFGPAASVAAVLILYAIPRGGSIYSIYSAFFFWDMARPCGWSLKILFANL